MTEYLYKVLVVGNNKVGKTAFLERYINNRFSAQYKTTLGGLNYSSHILFKILQYTFIRFSDDNFIWS